MEYMRDRNIRSDEYAEGQLDRINGWALPEKCHEDYREGWLDKDAQMGKQLATVA